MFGAKLVPGNAEVGVGEPEDPALERVAFGTGDAPVPAPKVTFEYSRKVGPLALLFLRHVGQSGFEGALGLRILPRCMTGIAGQGVTPRQLVGSTIGGRREGRLWLAGLHVVADALPRDPPIPGEAARSRIQIHDEGIPRSLHGRRIGSLFPIVVVGVSQAVAADPLVARP
jgi:hypothetical protein